MCSVSQIIETKPPNPYATPASAEGGPHSSIPLKFYTKVISNTEKRGFNSQVKRFQYPENENPGPGLYNVIHQSMLLNNVSQSQKGTCFFPSLDVRIAHQRIPNYPASNAYNLPPTLHSKRDFSLGYSSMFHPPFARKISKRATPAPNQYNVSVDLCKENCRVGAKSVFSSKTKRALSLSSNERVPSPCHYRIKDSLIRQSPPVLASCFKSKTGRTTNPETLSPGPAAYQQPAETPVGPSKRFSGLRKCILNFSAPAIPPPPNPPSPGPGQYDIVDYSGPPKHYISSAVFVSNTSRWTGDTFHQVTPGPEEQYKMFFKTAHSLVLLTSSEYSFTYKQDIAWGKNTRSGADIGQSVPEICEQSIPRGNIIFPSAIRGRAYDLPIPRKQSFIYNITNKWVPVL